MEKKHVEVPDVGLRHDHFNIRKLGVKFRNACMRVATPDHRKVMRLAAPDRQRVKDLLEQFTFGDITTGSYRGTRSKDDIKCCYLQLQSFSPKIANDFRRWAFDLLKAEHKSTYV